METEIAGLTALRNQLVAKGEALRSTGNEHKQATVALIEDIVSG